MIDAAAYFEEVKRYFIYLITEYSFWIRDEEIRANVYYDLRFRSQEKEISISYENLEDYFLVRLYLLHDGQMPKFNDKEGIMDLRKLNEVIISRLDKQEILLNNEFFANFSPSNLIGREILKAAKDLRLCLKHFDEL
ncbi:MAG: hypothetical protein Q8927_08630 [Bacteroidota bacterium]|nr:hypothetical protein [Bacteroidota bacterium]MDP4253702.1 hypothetical protein [Bacteroidota bacterium]MDP4259986.1 hypothetical protein [Bacteroidota bacterium]